MLLQLRKCDCKCKYECNINVNAMRSCICLPSSFYLLFFSSIHFNLAPSIYFSLVDSVFFGLATLIFLNLVAPIHLSQLGFPQVALVSLSPWADYLLIKLVSENIHMGKHTHKKIIHNKRTCIWRDIHIAYYIYGATYT